jgi:thymidylate synthase (methanogen type)
MAQVFFVSEDNIRDAWLTAIGKVLYQGDEIKTEYDDPNDPPSKDATVMIEVKNPMSNPITRKGKPITIKSKFGNSYELYGCLADTYLMGSVQSGYIEEILEGRNDHFLWESGLSFPYSYHNRIFNYVPLSVEDTVHVNYDVTVVDNTFVRNHKKLIEAEKVTEEGDNTVWHLKNGIEFDLGKSISEQIGFDEIPIGVLKFPEINQIEYIISKLKTVPYSRRAQAITWRPLIDPFHVDPPCLQRIWMRIKNDELIMQTTWRSRDLLRAWEANVNGMVRLQKQVADRLNVKLGPYLDFSNSLHIYGNTIAEVEDLLNRMDKKGELPEEIKNLRNSH